jgi:hypothetical protein
MMRTLINRVKSLFTNPEDFWDDLLSLPDDLGVLLVPHVLALAAIPAIASFLGTLIGGASMAGQAGIVGRLVGFALVTLVLEYAFTIGTWIALGMILDALAPSFEARRDFQQSMKLATGTMSPLWLGALLYLTSSPLLGLLGTLGGLGYGGYVLYLGLPRANGTPDEKRIPYVASAIGILVGLVLLIGVVRCSMYGCCIGSALVSHAIGG